MDATLQRFGSWFAAAICQSLRAGRTADGHRRAALHLATALRSHRARAVAGADNHRLRQWSGRAGLRCRFVAPRTRRQAGWATAALFVVVFPANVQMALRSGARSTLTESACGRGCRCRLRWSPGRCPSPAAEADVPVPKIANTGEKLIRLFTGTVDPDAGRREHARFAVVLTPAIRACPSRKRRGGEGVATGDGRERRGRGRRSRSSYRLKIAPVVHRFRVYVQSEHGFSDLGRRRWCLSLVSPAARQLCRTGGLVIG